MLEKLSKHHDLWISMLMKLGAGKDNANDLVQDMYIKIYNHPTNYNIEYGNNDVNKYYVYKTLKSLFIDKIRKENKLNTTPIETYSFEEDEYNEDRDIALFNLSDKIRDYISEWSVYDKRLVELYFGFQISKDSRIMQPKISQRQLAKETGIGLNSIHNSLKSIKKDLYNEFREEIEDYFNEDYELIC